MSEIDNKIRELQLVKEATKEEQLTKERRELRLKLSSHPFVKAFKDTLKEANWIRIAKMRKELDAQLAKQKDDAVSNVLQKVRYQLKAEDENITQEQLMKMFREIEKGAG